MTKIDIVSGFLGAGKTTLIKKMVKEAYQGEKLVLIENEFGEISIDGGFLKDAGIQISEMSSGCICCSLVGDFGKALREVKEQFQPDRILIEPSGVGKLSDVQKAVAAVNDELQLVSSCTVVDVNKCEMYQKNFGEFFNNQIEYANTLILSRTQGKSADEVEECMQLLHGLNPEASLVSTPWDQLDGKTIVEAMEHHGGLRRALMEEEEICTVCGHHHGHDHAHDHEHDHEHHHEDECGCAYHHHHADEVFTSWGAETPKQFTQADIDRILTALDSGEYGAILRAKGIVPAADGQWLHFDYVPQEHEVRYGAADYTGRLCVIGSQLKEDGLKTLFGL